MAQLTKSTKPVSAKTIDRKWHLVDVKGKIVGRVAPQIANLLQGKGKVDYAPYLDNGDYVVVINASGVKFTGSKMQDKIYGHYSGYPSGLKLTTPERLLQTNPARIVKEAVSGMLPKNKLRDRRLSRLYVYGAENHPYQNKFKK